MEKRIRRKEWDELMRAHALNLRLYKHQLERIILENIPEGCEIVFLEYSDEVLLRSTDGIDSMMDDIGKTIHQCIEDQTDKHISDWHTVEWKSKNRPPQCPPDPNFPEGKSLMHFNPEDLHCKVPLPYPAECCGTWIATCQKCGLRVAATAAGRPDDPRSLTVTCRWQQTEITKQ